MEAFVNVFLKWCEEERESTHICDQVARLKGELAERDEEMNRCQSKAKLLAQEHDAIYDKLSHQEVELAELRERCQGHGEVVRGIK